MVWAYPLLPNWWIQSLTLISARVNTTGD